mgnify:CR=1 FL=1
MEKKEAYKTHFKNLDEMGKCVGKELGISDWIEITQDKISVFAKITEDEQWIHLDAEKCAKESPYKTTIAHGFMILSLASRFSYDTVTIGSVKMGVNYGVDKVRFMSATPSGGLVRGRVSLLEFEIKPVAIIKLPTENVIIKIIIVNLSFISSP